MSNICNYCSDNKKRAVLLFIATCGALSVILQNTLLRGNISEIRIPYAIYKRDTRNLTHIQQNMTENATGSIYKRDTRNLTHIEQNTTENATGSAPNYPEVTLNFTNVRDTPNVTSGKEKLEPVEQRLLKKNRYDFVEFKKKPGWHFVKFPCHYKCSSYGASVTVRYTEKPADTVGADAVFFSTGPFELDEWQALQHYRTRTPDQIWVFATQEPASIVPDFLPPKVYRHSTYNWSFTFHSTSDINGAYGWYTPFKTPRNLRTDNWYSKKPKSAAWVSSRHCEGLGWDRTKFVLDLGKLIDIDMYGTCGSKTIPRDTKNAKRILSPYKFHLSLENSCCSEYLTEKVWNSLEKWESVPIVLGGTREEYLKLMPPHSYIHADDFDSIEHLAKHIKTLSQNETLYNKYFAWRSLGSVKQQSFAQRFPVHRDGACKVVGRFKRTPLGQRSFDPYGPNWFGSCYRCGNHDWIQAYNIWWRRTIFSKEWEDNRTLHWLDQT